MAFDWGTFLLRGTNGATDATTLRAAAVEAHSRLLDDPTIARYIEHVRTDASDFAARNTEPWTATAEKRYYALMLFRKVALGERVLFDDNQFAATNDAGFGLDVARALLMSMPYLWGEHVMQVAASSQLPPHVIARDVLQHPIMFWSWETAHGLRDNENIDQNWQLYMDYGTHFRLVGDLHNGSDPDFRLGCHDIRYGRTYPHDFADDPDAMRTVLSRLAFLNSPYVASDERRHPRWLRRESEKSSRKGKALPPVQETSVIVLRRPAVARPVESTEQSHGTEWHHQWWVRAHYRAQWYPSQGAHKVIWVAPFLKGPSDKPLLERTYKVAR